MYAVATDMSTPERNNYQQPTHDDQHQPDHHDVMHHEPNAAAAAAAATDTFQPHHGGIFCFPASVLGGSGH